MTIKPTFRRLKNTKEKTEKVEQSTKHIFADKPIKHLLGERIKAEEINDDKIGRFMDELYEYSLESLWTSLAINTINKYEIKTKYSHLDSSFVPVRGEYKINPKQEERTQKKSEKKSSKLLIDIRQIKDLV